VNALEISNADLPYALVTINTVESELAYTRTTVDSNLSEITYTRATVDANTAGITYVGVTADANLAEINYTQTTVNANAAGIAYVGVTADANLAEITYTQVTVDANLADLTYATSTIDANSAGLAYATATVDANLAELTYTQASVDAMVATTNLFVDLGTTTNIAENKVRLGSGWTNIVLELGQQYLGTNERAAFIKRVSRDDLQIHSYKSMYLTTGYQHVGGSPGIYRHKAAFDNATDVVDGEDDSTDVQGVIINTGTILNQPSWGNSLNPVSDASNKVKRDDFAFTMEHIKSDEMDFDVDGVLRLSLEGENIGDDNNYIAFTGNNNSLIGSISGHDNSVMGIAQTGVKLESIGADYAEYLPLIDLSENIEGGDIVGVYEGKITLNTASANRVMAVSTMPVVLGNWRGKNTKEIARPVAFVGQVPVKVRGAVTAGDYIVPSGLHDGYGIAVAKADLQPHHLDQIIGQAWSNSSEDEGLVNVAITPLDKPNTVIKKLESDNKELRSELETLKTQVEALQKVLEN
jgi:hypothetical protein